MCKRYRPRDYDFQLLQTQQSDQNNQVPATLQSVEYKCQIINNILKTTLVQTFRSQSDNVFSETQYMFPINENICLESFEARYNDKTIKGIVKDKENAKKEYKSNKILGNFVTYAEFQKNKREEYIKIMIGNLPPGVQVEIVLSFSQQLESILNKYYFTSIPMQYVEDVFSAKFGKNVLTLDLFCTGRITYATSKGYSAQFTMIDDNTARFTLSQASLKKNMDFQLIFSYEGMFDPQIILGSSKVYHEDQVKRNILPVNNSAMVTFIPNFNQELDKEIDDTIRAAIMNGEDILSEQFQQNLNQELIDHLNSSRSEFIFLLDRSYSMGGKPIQKAIEALTLFLKSLPNDSYFNVISFGSRFEYLFPQSYQYNSKNMNDAIQIICKFTADLVSTDIYSPLENIFNNQQRIQGYNKQIFLLTDGEVEKPENVVNLIKKNNKYNRIHSIGFGSNVDKSLIEQTSFAGKGIYKIIEFSSDLSEVIINMLSKSITPTYDDFTLIYDKSIFDSTHPTSTDFPCVFKDEIINIHLFFKPHINIQELNDAQKVIQIEYYDSQKKQKVKKDIKLEMSDCFTCNTDLQESVFKLGKQLYLNECMELNKGGNELTQQAIDFQLMTQKTALLCVIESLNDEQKVVFQTINTYPEYEETCVKKSNRQISPPHSVPSMIYQSQGPKQNDNCNDYPEYQEERIKRSRRQVSPEERTKKSCRSVISPPTFIDQLKTLCLEISPPHVIPSVAQQFQASSFLQMDSQSQTSLSLLEQSQINNNNATLPGFTSNTMEMKQTISTSLNPQMSIQQQEPHSFNINQNINEISIYNSHYQNQFNKKDMDCEKQLSSGFFDKTLSIFNSEEFSQQQIKQKIIAPVLNLDDILKLIDSEGICKYDYQTIQQCSNLSKQIVNEFIQYFNNLDAFMSLFIICILEQFYNSDKSKWVLISKKSTSYVKKNLTQNKEINEIKQKLIVSLKN